MVQIYMYSSSQCLITCLAELFWGIINLSCVLNTKHDENCECPDLLWIIKSSLHKNVSSSSPVNYKMVALKLHKEKQYEKVNCIVWLDRYYSCLMNRIFISLGLLIIILMLIIHETTRKVSCKQRKCMNYCAPFPHEMFCILNAKII